MIELELDRLLKAAKSDSTLKSELLAARQSDNPVEDFCSLCQKKGYDITIGELFAVGQDANDAKLRSVNGGGVNGIDGWDDAYEQFFLTSSGHKAAGGLQLSEQIASYENTLLHPVTKSVTQIS